MTTDRGALVALLATLIVMSATPAAAQTEQAPQAAPVRGLEGLAAPQTTQIPVPDAPKIVLPGTTPPRALRSRSTTPSSTTSKTSAAPADDPVAARGAQQSTTRARTRTDDTNAATEERRSPVRTTPPTTRSTMDVPTTGVPMPPNTPTVEPTRASTTPSATIAPLSVTPDPAQTPASTPGATQESTLTAPETGRAMPLWLSLAVIVVVLAALWLLRRRRPASRYDRGDASVVPEPLAEPLARQSAESDPVPVAPPVAVPETPPVARTTVTSRPATAAAIAPQFLEPRAKSPPPTPRARLSCELRPLRAGLNLLTATVECELVVTNTGNAPAESVRAAIALLTAHTDQDTDLAAFNAAPAVRPVAAPFVLAAGETRTLRAVVAIAREAIRTMTAANRPMFVPVVATNLRYVTAASDAQTARAWSIGIERVDSAKLAPFWLDAPARMYSSVAARPHAAEFSS